MFNHDQHKISARRSLKGLLLTTCLAFAAAGVLQADSLKTVSYNFKLGDGGGGASAVLNGTQNIEIFCVDFNNNIYVPSSNLTANLTTITSGSNLSQTRFGGVTSWQQVTISGDATDSSTINTATAFQRYEMAAYLVSQYNVGAGGTAANNGIQEAIWTILDPTPYASYLPNIGNATVALTAAAQWLNNTSQTDMDAFLAGYRIVSDATMTAGSNGGPKSGGFQEQITKVPEPGVFAFLALCLAGLMSATRRNQAAGVC